MPLLCNVQEDRCGLQPPALCTKVPQSNHGLRPALSHSLTRSSSVRTVTAPVSALPAFETVIGVLLTGASARMPGGCHEHAAHAAAALCACAVTVGARRQGPTIAVPAGPTSPATHQTWSDQCRTPSKLQPFGLAPAARAQTRNDHIHARFLALVYGAAQSECGTCRLHSPPYRAPCPAVRLLRPAHSRRPTQSAGTAGPPPGAHTCSTCKP